MLRLSLTLGAITAVIGYAALSSGGLPQTNLNLPLFLLGLTCVFNWSLPDRDRGQIDRVTLLLLTALLAAAALQVQFSVKPAATLTHVFRIASYIAVFLIAWDVSHRSRRRPWMAAAPVLAIALVEAVLGLVQVHLAGAELANGTYPNRNHFAGLLEMALPFALLLAVSILRNSSQRFHSPALPALKACGVFAAAAAMLVAILHSLSRGGYLSTLASLFTVGALALGRSGVRKWLPLGLMAVLVVAAFIFLPTDQLIARFAHMAASEEITADDRAQLWRETLDMIAAYPAFGCGLGAYESGFYRFKMVAPLNTADFAHNDYLQVLAEFGVLGFALVAAIVVRLLVRIFRATLGGGSHRYLAVACGGAFTAILLHSFVDFNLYIPANAMVLSWIAGMAEALPTPRRAG